MAVLLASLAATSQAATYFVRSGGDDRADGTTPATALRSISVAAMKIRNPGDEVVIGPGTYLEGNIGSPRSGILGRPVAFRGDPSGRRTGDAPGPVRIVPQAPATTGFLILGKRYIEITDVEIVGGSDAGIQVRPSADGVVSADFLVARVVVRGSGKRGIDLRGVSGQVRVEQSVVTENETSGMYIEGDGMTTDLVLAGCRAESNGAEGIFVRSIARGVIWDSEVRGNRGAGLMLVDSVDVSVLENRFEANREESVNAGVQGAVTNVAFIGNRSNGSGKSAFKIVGKGDIRLERNSVEGVIGPAAVGVSVSADSDAGSSVAMQENDLRLATGDCVFLTGIDTVVLEANRVRECQGNGFRLERNRNIRSAGNSVEGPQQSGILVAGGASVDMVGDLIYRPGQPGVAVKGSEPESRRLRVHGSKIFGAGSIALFAEGIASARVQALEVDEGPGDGIVLRRVKQVDVRRVFLKKLGGLGLAVGSPEDMSAASVHLVDSELGTLGKGAVKLWGSGSIAVSGSSFLDSGGPGISVEVSRGGSVNIVRNIVGMHQADGIFVRGATSGEVVSNVVFSNRQSGIVLRATDQIFAANNLVYANREEGLAVGVGGEFSTRTKVLFNTLYANGLRGLRIDGPAASSIAGGMVLNNIFAGNAGGGVAIARTAMADLLAGFNVNADGYASDTRRNHFDIAADPLFVDPAGPDHVLGEEGYEDDNFRLAQRRTGQAQDSPAVDAASDTVDVLGITGSTALDGAPDRGRADIGFHYSQTPESLSRSPRLPFMPLFVAARGSDNNTGLSPAEPLASIGAAFESALAGVTVVVGPGTYREGDIRIRNFSGKVSFVADPTGYWTGDLPGPVLVDASGFDTAFVILNGGPVTVRGFHITGASVAGIQVRSGADRAEVRDNFVFSNQRRGIEVNGANEVQITNNLVYANGTGGIQIQASRNSTVENNTVYGNGGDGILVGVSSPAGAAPGTVVRRNIVADNGEGLAAANGVQIKVEPNSLAGLRSGYNVVWGRTPFAGNTPRADSDIIADPLFSNPAGPDGVLGQTGFADDDFTLIQDVTRGALSPAVDLDFTALDAGLAGTTSPLGIPDTGPLDVGFHRPLFHVTVRTGPIVFVRVGGDDRNPGSSAETAVASIDRALAVTGGGGFVVIGPGTYRAPSLALGGWGANGKQPILWGDETGSLTGDPPGPVILDFAGGRGLTIRGPAVVQGLWLTRARSSGVRILGSASAVWIRDSVFCGNEGDGLWSAGSGVDLINNLLCGNAGWGARLTPRRGRGYVRLVNATLVRNAAGGIWAVDRSRPYVQLRFGNNVIATNGDTGAMLYAGSGRLIPWGYNLNADGYAKARVTGPGERSAAPGFATELSGGAPACPQANSYRLAPGSPAIDVGAGDPRFLGIEHRSATSDGVPDRGAPDLGYHGPPGG